MTVITISREYGSQGECVAQKVAETLGYQLANKHTFEKILRQYGMVQLDELYKTATSFWARVDMANLELVSMLNKITLGFAKLNNMVILGRGGYAVLHDYADVLHVRVQAPFDVRVRRIMEREGLQDVAVAEKVVAKNDKARAMFVQGFYDADFYTTRSFHLVLDSSVIPLETAATWVVEAARLLEPRSFRDSLTTRNIEVEPILAGAIEQVLHPA